MFATQTGFDVRFDWGAEGVSRLASGSDPVASVVLVDVLRFTSAVEAATSSGVTVEPGAWSPGARTTLSPASLAALPRGSRIVVPSPNGAACSRLADRLGLGVVAGCLRNASAVAAAALTLPSPLAVIACGELDPGGMRFALEDLLGAGAILASLHDLSPEASVAAAAFESVGSRATMPDLTPGAGVFDERP